MVARKFAVELKRVTTEVTSLDVEAGSYEEAAEKALASLEEAEKAAVELLWERTMDQAEVIGIYPT